MHSTKILLPVAALAGASVAQFITQSYPDPACTKTVNSFVSGAPTLPPALSPYLASAIAGAVQTGSAETTKLPPDTLADPEGYVELLCSVAAELPSSVLPEFESWGAGLLSYGSAHISDYDAFVTQCVTTGEAAATITSYLNALLTGTAGFCQPTATSGGASNGTISTTLAPTATHSTNSTTSISTTSAITGAAARPTAVLVGAAAMGGLIGAAALL